MEYRFLINQAIEARAWIWTELGGPILTREGNHGLLIQNLGEAEKVAVLPSTSISPPKPSFVS